MSTARIIPGRLLPLLCALCLPLFALGSLGRLVCFLLLVGLLVLAWLEALGLRRAAIIAGRDVPPRLLLGEENRIVVELRNDSGHALRGTLRDGVPPGFSATPKELGFVLPARGRTSLVYVLRAPRRGLYELGDVHLRLEGRWGLGAALVTLPARAQVRVYPSLHGLRRYELAARLGTLHSVGVRTARRVGTGGEIEALREYVPGDGFRELDWKASAKRLRPITRVRGQEQSQTVVLALDAGRIMGTRLGELTKLDHAIHAALLVTWVALRAGDKVGLLVFAERVHTFVPPGRGQAQYRRVLDALFALEASPTYVDFRLLTEALRARVPKRSLLLLFSDLLDESQALPLAAEAKHLGGKHLPVCVTMNDPATDGLARMQVKNASDVYVRAAATDILADRATVKAHLQRAGVGLVEATAGELAIATVNRYLEIRARHAL